MSESLPRRIPIKSLNGVVDNTYWQGNEKKPWRDDGIDQNGAQT